MGELEMSNVTKKGKIPSSQKATINSDFDSDSQDFSRLRIDPALKVELKEKGLSHRWINYKKFMSDGNFHQSGWVPYKPAAKPTGAVEFSFGSNPEGYVIRGDLILAVKTEEQQAHHKARLARKNAIYQQYNKQAASQLKEHLKGTKSKVYEGYEENGDDED
jgi:hypothetical protein